MLDMRHADVLKGQPLPDVDSRGVNALLPIVIRSQFVSEVEVEKCEKVNQLEISVVSLRLTTHLCLISTDDVATHQVFKLFTQCSTG